MSETKMPPSEVWVMFDGDDPTRAFTHGPSAEALRDGILDRYTIAHYTLESAIEARIKAAVAVETRMCAQLLDDYALSQSQMNNGETYAIATRLANLIRARGATKNG